MFHQYNTLELTLYDSKDGNVLRRTSDVIYLHGYKTEVVSKELSVNSGATPLKYGVLSIDDPWNLCTNHGTITINDTLPLDQNETRTYSAQLRLGEEVIAANGENGKISVSGNTINWNDDLFAGKTAANGVYACELIVNDKSFDLIVPDRKYYSYSVSGGDKLDPVAPGELATVEGDIFIHFEGEGQEQYSYDDTYTDQEGEHTYLHRELRTIGEYTSTLLENMSENAHVFVDMSDVTGIQTAWREDVRLTTTGAWLEGIAFPDSVTKVDTGTFMCPIKQAAAADDRYYELTVVFGSAANDVYALVSAEDAWQYHDTYWDTGDPVNNSDKRNLYNPFKKFIVSKDNSRLVTYQDGALLGNMTGNEHVDLIASADVIEQLEMPLTINTVERDAFAGNRKLKKIVEWGITDVIRDDAFNSCALEGDLELGVRVAFIGTRAFIKTNIESIIFSDSMKVFQNNIVPDDVCIGYKPGSNKVVKWNWITDATVDTIPGRDLWTAYNGWDSSKFFPDNPDGTAIILDCNKISNYQYANYLGQTNFKDHFFWHVDE